MRIALVSDTHLAARAAVCLDNWRVVRAWIQRARPDLVVHLGDITVDGASDAVELRDAVDAFAGLDVPLRFLPGNHDIGDNPIATELDISHDASVPPVLLHRPTSGARPASSPRSWARARSARRSRSQLARRRASDAGPRALAGRAPDSAQTR